MSDDLTPMRQQYLDIKGQYPDKLLLFRLGDFYEAFDGDAEIIARELDLTLTARPNKNGKIPMAGVPHHAVDGYIARLVEKGFHVVVADQMEPPGKKLVRREVTRVITPGTVVAPEMLEQRRNNYLLALYPEADTEGKTWTRVGIAYCDITTGEFAATQIGGRDPKTGGGQEATVSVLEELARLAPREVLLPKVWVEAGVSLPAGAFLTAQPDQRFLLPFAQKTILTHFAARTLDGFGLGDKPLAVGAAGAILAYIGETMKASLPTITALRAYDTSGYMVLDANTRRNLELTETMRTGKVRGSLLGILDRTATPMGGRLLRTWIAQPLLDVGRLNARLDAVTCLFEEGRRRAEVIEALKPIADIERLTSRILSKIATPRDLLALQGSLGCVPDLKQAIFDAPALYNLRDRLDHVPHVAALIEAAISENPPNVLNERVGVIRPGYSPELDQITANTRHARDWIADLEGQERQRTGIKSLKVGFNKVTGYYIEVSHANAERVPADYIRKQTLTNAERYITPDLKDYETLVLNAEERMIALEAELFHALCAEIARAAPALLMTARAVAHLDAFAALAEVAVREGYSRPEITTDDVLIIQDGRHPVVEKLLEGAPYIPNDHHFDPEQRVHLITGPNMAGKSTAIRQVAVITLMAQVGSYVPARVARIGIVDRIFTRIGAQDEIHAGRSTFMVEMTETAALLAAATSRSLLILDEIGRGTSTYDGLAIARAVIEFIHNHPRLNAKTLFATHYHELTELEAILPRVRNYNVAVLEEGDHVVFLHKLVPGGADRSYGIHVAQLAGMPKAVVSRAREILKDLESGGSDFALPTLHPSPPPRPKGISPNQMALIPETDHPLVAMVKALRVEEMSPLEAMTKLYELQRMARGG
ncbi:MAG TPA: DNA mismatch repair protein MutS [Aggregatilineales bacterium]|nr:DNA mismatch repair protein MutS [Anaerolineales bacterium]HRE49715.1 DNA mismatch repair protein MutS [Aggregatilineales bacterium]